MHYWHALEGRLRIKVPEIKRSHEKARQVEDLIGSLDGVLSVTANPTTANVLVLFCPKTRTHADIVASLRRADYLHLPSVPPSSLRDAERLMNVLARTIARSITEALVHRAFTALL